MYNAQFAFFKGKSNAHFGWATSSYFSCTKFFYRYLISGMGIDFEDWLGNLAKLFTAGRVRKFL